MYQTNDNYKQLVYADSTQHLLNIYIAGNKVNENHIFDFRISNELFQEEFCFGSVAAKTVEMKIYKDSLPQVYNNFYIESGINGEIVPIGYFNLEEIQKNDDNTITIKAIDNMIKFEFNYDGSNLDYPCTLMTVLNDICLKAGVELGSTSFLNSNTQIAVYDNSINAREYLSYIAEQAGGFACIGRDGKLYIKTIGQERAELSINYFQDFTWGEKFKISCIRYEDGIQLFEKGNMTDNTVYINQNNMYIVKQEQIDNIYEELNGLEIYSFEGSSIIDPALDIGDVIIIDGKSVVFQGDIEYVGKFKSNISSKIRCKAQEETTTKIITQKVINRRIQSQINQEEQRITQLAEKNTEHEQKLTKVEQDIDVINQKVENTIDYKREVEEVTEIHITDAGKANILKLEVKGNKTYEANLFPDENLYPGELYPNQEVM